MRIMYVEDNLANLNLVKRIARVGGHDVVSHANGVEALKALETDPCHLILMDIELEGAMDGIEVVKALRARGDERPIIAITAYAMAGDKERILDAGCNEYLPKPLPISQFLTFMAKYDPKNIQPKMASVEEKVEKAEKVDEDKDPTKPREGEDKDTIAISDNEETIPAREMIAKSSEAKTVEAKAVPTTTPENVPEAEAKVKPEVEPEKPENKQEKADAAEDPAKRETVTAKSVKDEQQPNANP